MSKFLKIFGVNLPNTLSQSSHLTAFAGSLHDPQTTCHLTTNSPVDGVLLFGTVDPKFACFNAPID